MIPRLPLAPAPAADTLAFPGALRDGRFDLDAALCGSAGMLGLPAEATHAATGYSCRSQAKRLDNEAPRHPLTALLAALRAVKRTANAGLTEFQIERKP